MTKLVLIAALSTTPVWSAPEANDKSPDKPALKITPFTLKSSDGTMEFRMDENGKLFAEGKHFATVHPEGKLTSPEGELMLKLNQKGILETSKGDTGEDPIEITEDGTLKQAGATLKWADGKLDFGNGKHLTLEPKDSPATRAALLCLAAAWGGVDRSLMARENKFGPHTLRIQPVSKNSEHGFVEGGIVWKEDNNTFKLVNEEFHFNGKNHGKLPAGSKISWKEGILTINGKVPAEPKE